MSAPHPSTARPRTRLLVVAIACAAALWIGSALFRQTQAESERGVRPAEPATEAGASTNRTAPTELGATGLVQRALAVAQPADATPVSESEPEAERDLRDEAWALVARLEELARTPSAYHAAALPVVDALTEVLTPDAASVDEALAVAQELMREVVAAPARDALVRGGVFLALAPRLREPEFWATFGEWTSGHADVPLELVRTAALAAARSGDPSPCSYPLPLSKLADLPSPGVPELPGFYPLVLDRIASGRACDALRRWMDLDDPRKRHFQVSQSAPADGAALAPVADYCVTYEVLYGVWGHRSLADTRIERAVLEDAEFSLADLLGRNLVSLRAANFLVLALARCDTSFMDAALAATSASDGLEPSFADDLRNLLAEELGSVTIERLERLRYSTRSIDEGELILVLADLREGFERGEAHDPEQRALLLDYLCGLVADPALTWMARLGAVQAVASGGSWEALRTAAAAALRPGTPSHLAEMALPRFVEAAGSSPERRAEALALLQQFAAQSPALAAKLHVDAYIENLTQ